MTALFALFDSLFVAISGFSAGVAGRHRSVLSVLLIASPTSFVIVLIAVLLVPGVPTWPAIGWGLLAGVVGGAGLIFSYRGLALGPVGIVSASTQCISVALVTAVGAVGRGISTGRILALAMAISAVLLICQVRVRRAADLRKQISAEGPLFGAVAGAAFGIFVIAIGSAPSNAGLWAVLAARGTVWGVVAILHIRSRLTRAVARSPPDSSRPSASSRGTGVTASLFAGATDASSNIFLALAVLSGDLVLIALIGALSPGLTAVLGRCFLQERLTPSQILGLVLATAAGAVAAL